MQTRLVIIAMAVALATACSDRSGSASGDRALEVSQRATTSPRTTSAAASARPALTAPSPSIANLDAAPADARERLVSTALAIEGDRKAEFLATISSGGFVAGELALIAEQVEVELAGRSVAELTNVRCAGAEPCRWSVTMLDPRRLELEAHSDSGAVGAVVLVHEDDGSWAVASARP